VLEWYHSAAETPIRDRRREVPAKQLRPKKKKPINLSRAINKGQKIIPPTPSHSPGDICYIFQSPILPPPPSTTSCKRKLQCPTTFLLCSSAFTVLHLPPAKLRANGSVPYSSETLRALDSGRHPRCAVQHKNWQRATPPLPFYSLRSAWPRNIARHVEKTPG